MSNQIMIYKNIESILALTIGIALVLLVAISYLDIWHPRVDKKYWVTQILSWWDVFTSVPWVLIITYGGISVMAVIVLIYYAYYPPNW